MELILATSDGREERTIWDNIDFEIGGEGSEKGQGANTFEIALSYPDWDKSYSFGKRIYEPGTEHGGIIKDIEGATNTDMIYVRGYTWRGYLAHRIIEPPAGSDYKTVSGELNSVISSLVGSSLGSLFQVSSASTGVSVSNYQFDRYTTLEAGLTKMLATKGYKLNIRYVQTDLSGYVLLEAIPANNYGNQVEISQDSLLNFANRDYRMGTNHLICLGVGELKDRTVIHLYANANGVISQTKTITGLEEVVEIFDNPGADSDVLLTTGTERLKTLLNEKSFTAAVKGIDNIDLTLGDTITGRDYITGTVVTKPIVQKIVRRENGLLTVDYKIEGEE